MRFRARAVFGFALVVVEVAGCASSRPSRQDPQAWLRSPTAIEEPVVLNQADHHKHSVPPSLRQAARQFNFTHPRVDDFVEKYQTNLRGFYSRALSRSGRYLPQMTAILKREGVPPELAYLPLVESGFSTRAVSRAGAVGPWQFIPGTGRRYGLRIDNYVDERRDPVKSTEAAARYLKDLHDMFGDWHLALAGYNTGEGRIQRILENGNAADFWEMGERGYLCDETKNYVPGFLAAVQIAVEPQAYGFDPPSCGSVDYDAVNVDRERPLRLSTVAQLSGCSLDELRELNPALHRGVVPPQGYTVYLPKGAKETFEVALANYVDPPPRVVRGKRGRGRSRSPAVRKARSGKAVAVARTSKKAAGRGSVKRASASSRRQSTVVASGSRGRRRAVN
jgi:membrane-bound lytic murein transglycosylase D